LEELVNEKKRLGLTTKIFAVTALTSLTDSDTQAIYDDTAKHTVLKLAKDALDA
jgi:orotidine-5'-phosphate decarboxylase